MAKKSVRQAQNWSFSTEYALCDQGYSPGLYSRDDRLQPIGESQNSGVRIIQVNSAVRAPIGQRARIKLGFFAKMAKILVQAHRHSREAQNLLRAHDAILKDVDLTRLNANENTYLFSHCGN
jgi:hypothetical protein